MLLGEYEHTIDEKNRLTLPARFRRSFADGVVLTKGMDGCVYAYPRPRWEELVSGRRFRWTSTATFVAIRNTHARRFSA